MNNKRHYGIEIECIMPKDVDLETISVTLNDHNISNHWSEEYYSNTNGNTQYWDIKQDSSIHGNGAELASPALHGMNGVEQVKQVCSILSDLDCYVDPSCGLHVHHECTDFSDQAIVNLFNIYRKYQKCINLILPKSRWNNSYAKALTHFVRHENKILTNYVWLRTAKNWLLNKDRYFAVYLGSYSIRGTVEFRQHSGTIEMNKIINWVCLTQRFCDIASSEIPIKLKIVKEFQDMLKELDLEEDVKEYYFKRYKRLNKVIDHS